MFNLIKFNLPNSNKKFKNLVIKYSYKKFYLQYLIFFLIIIVPQIFFYEDLWDGVIFNYAQIINNFDGAKYQLYEPGWVLNYWFILTIIKISNFFGVEYYAFCILALAVLYYLFLKEVRTFIKYQISNDENFIAKVLFLVSIFSIQSYYFSSIMLWHLFCQYSILYGVRFFHKININLIIISLFFLFISFSYKSALIYIFVLSTFYNHKKIINIKNLILISYGLSIFIFFHFYLKNFGRSENYAQIINFFDYNSIAIVLKTFISYCTFLLPILVILFFYLIVIKIYKIKVNFKEFKIFFNKNLRLIILFLCSIIPYMAIGRMHVMWDIFDWSGRTAIFLILPLSIISIKIIDLFYNLKITSKKIANYSFIFLFLFNFTLLIEGVLYKVNRIIYQKELGKIIKQQESNLKDTNGILIIVDKYKIRPIFRSFELNYLTFKTIGVNDLWVLYQNKLNIDLVKYPQNNKYKNADISNFYSKDPPNNQCFIVINISSSKFERIYNKIKNIFFKNNFSVKFESLNKINC